ncbi:MAG: hypothetical protein PHN88_01355 [Ignavibacteria bacterium]|nr:hypothetical protein [Ignavibacteria bacterium]
MKKYIAVILVLISFSAANAQLGSYAGGFARMGFGARGLSMGNALVSDTHGDISGYYNPSLSCFQEKGIVNLGYTFLSLDRKLNFVSFTKKFSLSGGKQTAGLSISWINAGVSNIDGRDNDARSVGMLSTYENQLMLGMSFLISPQVALGVGFKLYYSKLYDGVTTTNPGFDAGVTYIANKDLSFGLAVRDLGSKYKWVTSDPSIYGNNGTTTENKFPVLVDLGATYKLPKLLGIVSAAVETYIDPKYETKDTLGIVTKSDQKYNFAFKFGGEINLNEYVKVRAGIDRIDLKADDVWGNMIPGAGIGLQKSFSNDMNLELNYSFQLEAYTHKPIQNIGIAFKFK